MEGYKKVIILHRKDGSVMRVISPVYHSEWKPDESGCYCLSAENGHGIYAVPTADDNRLKDYSGTIVRVWLSGKIEHGERGFRVEAARIMDDVADLRGANLRGANLSGANLSGAYLSDANYCSHTAWPKYIDPAAAGAVMRKC